MPDTIASDLENEAIRAWRELFAVTALNIREAVSTVVRDGADALTNDFYERMLLNPRAGRFMDQERVQKRLRASLRQWMIDLFSTLEAEQIPDAIKRQVEVGVVHARIRLPVDLIPAGIRVLKRGIRRRIDFTALDSDERLTAQIYVSDLLHLADGLMNQAYFHDTQDVARNDEAFRLITQKRGSSFERARQRAALSEWAEMLLLATWNPKQELNITRLRDSEFGIWMHHKGAVLFEGSDEFASILEAIDTMDQRVLPGLHAVRSDHAGTDKVIKSIKQLLDLIRYKLNDLFESTSAKDDGLDHETQLPDRRYLPAVLAREMMAHQTNGRSFCLMLIEVQFPSIKDHQSQGTRNRMLHASVDAVAACARTTDHLFRFSEHQLLLIAVECDRGAAGDMAVAMSEALRNKVNTGNVQGSWRPISPSISIGIAEYDRHPDYQYFIQRVETALAEAIATKRTRIAIA